MMFKSFLFLALVVTNIFALEVLTPSKIYKATGTVQSIFYNENKLYAGTSNGTVDVFDIKTSEKIKEIKIADIKDFMGDTIPAKIYSIDFLNEKLLIVSQGSKGYRNIFLYEKDKLEKIVGIDKKYYIQKASFLSDEKIVFALLSNQIGKFDITSKKLDYLIQASSSYFSDYMLSENKKELISTDESGVVRTIVLDRGQITKDDRALNLDKVYQLDYKNRVVLTAGQDRQAVVYKNFSSYSLKFDFLLYSCGLSPSAKLGAIAFNEDNEVLVFDVDTKEKLYKLIGQKATLTQILFINEDEVFISSDDSNINYFKLKKGVKK